MYAECGGVLTANSGSFRSPQHGGVYPHGVNCTWFITAPAGFIIQLTFESFSLERHYSCQADYVEIFDGYTSDHSFGRYATLLLIMHRTIGLSNERTKVRVRVWGRV